MMDSKREESDWRNYREMGIQLRAVCNEAIAKRNDLPTDVIAASDGIDRVEITRFDHTYIEFLDDQIRLEARGPKWSKRLRSKRDAIMDFTGRELARCRILRGDRDFSFTIDPLSASVIHWEYTALTNEG